MPDGSIFPGLGSICPDISAQHDKALVQLINAMAEQSMLGAILARAELLEAVPTSFAPEHFAISGHAEIYRAIQAAAETQAKGPLLLQVGQALNADYELRDYVSKLIVAAVGFLPSLVRSYAGIVTDLYRKRQIIQAVERARADVTMGDGAIPADALVARTIADLDLIACGASVSQRCSSLDDAIDAAMQAAQDAAKRQGPAGLPTGFPQVDDRLGGLENGTLTVIAGRPGSGKSALGHQWALNVARLGVGVLEISLEMSAIELGRRALSAASGVPIWRMKRGKFDDRDADKMVKARAELRGLPLTIEDGAGLTAAMIGIKARSAQRRHGLGLVLVDHLHIVRPEDQDMRAGATWAVGRVSGAMKRLAKDMRCPVLLLAQLNRAVESREDHRPTLADLRQSGDIEQDADAVGFVYRPEMYLGKSEPAQKEGESLERYQSRVQHWHEAKARDAGRAELIIEKVRDGEPGSVILTFCGETTSFVEVAPQ